MYIRGVSYLSEYNRVPPDREDERVALVNQWIRKEWRTFFRELRESMPIFQTPKLTLVTRYRDVVDVLSRPDVFSVRLYARSMDPVVGPFMLARDNTSANWRDKSIMRTMLSWEDLPRVRQIAAQLADDVLARQASAGRVEVVSQLGRLVPVRICGAYFGFPGPDVETMLRWSKATQLDMFKNLGNDPVVHGAAVRAGEEIRAYLTDLTARRRQELPDASAAATGTDTLTRLLLVRYPDEVQFDAERIIANMAGLLIGSVETTSQAVVQSLQQLLLRPEITAQAQAAALSGDDAALDAIVFEALRFNPINPLLFRFCERDVTLAGDSAYAAELPAGSIVFACTASAMFDASELEAPDEFRPGRPPSHYFHFGFGHHECLGRYIGATLVPEIVKRVLLRPGVRLLPGPEGQIDFQNSPFPERFVVAYDG